MPKKRERLEVIYDILLCIRTHNNSIKPTRLLHSSNLSPQMFKEYTDELREKEFIIEKEISGRKEFSLSKKGFEYLEKYQTIISLIENFGL
jgi:predicted transcriptional regulator